MSVLAIDHFGDNGRLIAAVAELGYLKVTDHVLDPTYEKGVWWKTWQPDEITAHVWDPEDPARVDFRAMPHPDGTFDAVAFDPPYCAQGGKKTSTMKGYNAQYGRDVVESDPRSVQRLIDDGLTECARVVRDDGIVLVKCKNYIWSSKMFPGAFLTLSHAMTLGLELVDWFVFATKKGGPQPARTTPCPVCAGAPAEVRGGEECDHCKGSGRVAGTQKHARQNGSHLFVLRRPRGWEPPRPPLVATPAQADNLWAYIETVNDAVNDLLEAADAAGWRES